ncbi:PepSY-associated TM helix domain-containing protein [Luteolibacter pohnpeiensis]|uniref:PepSY-associated TM helix domain-containing protein n=1 Tax=Luteolibacter pohnpeiensis TaxID=454153 RepID=A0A934VVN1_9BACT|nr:PepSY-associated TM helix domain-containing protein [Luteolibacter pohnpeiensis]MBK1883732.1 PepSY-associated TM helix domain-containing protein [Luteolibacter pohnpeiensis]
MPADDPPKPSNSARNAAKKRKAFFTKQFYLWHWVSSALCLAAMLFFAVTGITLNHASRFSSKPDVREIKATLPPNLLKRIAFDGSPDATAPVPEEVADWLSKKTGTKLSGRAAEWSEYELYISLPRPGGDGWLSIDRETGEILHETTRRGTVAFINDLHKGRNTGPAWAWFIDLFSIACVVFCITGLCLLWVHAKRRPSTWPVVIAGIVIPLILILFFLHA